jgi:hypothetical protein
MAEPLRRAWNSIAFFVSTAAPSTRPLPKAAPYPSFAVIEIFAFSTFDTGQPFSAASAYF